MSREGIRSIVDDALKCVPIRQTVFITYLKKCSAMASDAAMNGINHCLSKDSKIDSNREAAQMASPHSSPQPNIRSSSENIYFERTFVEAPVSPHEVFARLWLALFRPDLVRDLRSSTWRFSLNEDFISILSRLVTHGFLVPGEHVQVDQDDDYNDIDTPPISDFSTCTQTNHLQSKNELSENNFPQTDYNINIQESSKNHECNFKSQPSSRGKANTSTILCMMDETIRLLTRSEKVSNSSPLLGSVNASSIELKLIQFLLTASTIPGPGMAIGGTNLRLALTHLAKVFGTSKFLVNQNTAKAALTQILTERMDEDFYECTSPFVHSHKSFEICSLKNPTSDSSSTKKSDGNPQKLDIPLDNTKAVIITWMCRAIRGRDKQNCHLPSCPDHLLKFILGILPNFILKYSSMIPISVLSTEVLPVIIQFYPKFSSLGDNGQYYNPSVESNIIEILSGLCVSQSILKRSKATVEIILVHLLSTFDENTHTISQTNGSKWAAYKGIEIQRRAAICETIQNVIYTDPHILMSFYLNFDCDPSMEPIVFRSLQFITESTSLTFPVNTSVLGQANESMLSKCANCLFALSAACDAWSVQNKEYKLVSIDSIDASYKASKAYRYKLVSTVAAFNRKPRDGINLSVELGVLGNVTKNVYTVDLNLFNSHLNGSTPNLSEKFTTDSSEFLPLRIAHWLRLTRGLCKKAIGEYLGNAQNSKILSAYVESFDFSKSTFVSALRQFMESFQIPGESQVIERFVEHFARHFCTNRFGSVTGEVGVLNDVAQCLLEIEGKLPTLSEEERSIQMKARVCDMVFQLSYSTIMLNTDMYSTSVREKMDISAFVKNSLGAMCPSALAQKSNGGVSSSIKSNLSSPMSLLNALKENFTAKEKEDSYSGVFCSLRLMLEGVYAEIAECEIQLYSRVVDHPLPAFARPGIVYLPCPNSETVVSLVNNISDLWASGLVGCFGSLFTKQKMGPSINERRRHSASSLNSKTSAIKHSQSFPDFSMATLQTLKVFLRVGATTGIASPTMGSTLDRVLGAMIPMYDSLRSNYEYNHKHLLDWIYEVSRTEGHFFDTSCWLAILRTICAWDMATLVDLNHNIIDVDILALDEYGTIAFMAALLQYTTREVVEPRQQALVAHYGNRLTQLPTSHLERVIRQDSSTFFSVINQFSSPKCSGPLRKAAFSILRRVSREQMPLLLDIDEEVLHAVLLTFENFNFILMGNYDGRADAEFSRDFVEYNISPSGIIALADEIVMTVVQIGELLLAIHIQSRSNTSKIKDGASESLEIKSTFSKFHRKWKKVIMSICRMGAIRVDSNSCCAALRQLFRLLEDQGTFFDAESFKEIWTAAIIPVYTITIPDVLTNHNVISNAPVGQTKASVTIKDSGGDKINEKISVQKDSNLDTELVFTSPETYPLRKSISTEKIFSQVLESTSRIVITYPHILGQQEILGPLIQLLEDVCISGGKKESISLTTIETTLGILGRIIVSLHFSHLSVGWKKTCSVIKRIFDSFDFRDHLLKLRENSELALPCSPIVDDMIGLNKLRSPSVSSSSSTMTETTSSSTSFSSANINLPITQAKTASSISLSKVSINGKSRSFSSPTITSTVHSVARLNDDTTKTLDELARKCTLQLFFLEFMRQILCPSGNQDFSSNGRCENIESSLTVDSNQIYPVCQTLSKSSIFAEQSQSEKEEETLNLKNFKIDSPKDIHPANSSSEFLTLDRVTNGIASEKSQISGVDLLTILQLLVQSHEMAASFNIDEKVRKALVCRGYAPTVEALLLNRQETGSLALLLDTLVSPVTRRRRESWTTEETQNVQKFYLETSMMGGRAFVRVKRESLESDRKQGMRRVGRLWSDLIIKVISAWSTDQWEMSTSKIGFYGSKSRKSSINEMSLMIQERVEIAVDVCVVCEISSPLIQVAKRYIVRTLKTNGNPASGSN